ncbi:MAG: 3'-5' exonuclease [Bacteroidetes bacterium]|nr:MAG: 3'-5' exonuclease [Bacteroidota bacterium]
MRLALQRWWYRRRLPSGPLRTLLEAPLPDRSRVVAATSFLAIDLETTGLDARTDQIVSIGSVPIVEGRIRLSEARYRVLRIEGSVNRSATIHGLRDRDVQHGEALEDVLPGLLNQLTDAVLLSHHAPFDLAFLNAACRRLYGGPLLVPVTDTLTLARTALHVRGVAVPKGGFRLAALRARYGLPPLQAHHALADALAAAELFLALIAHQGGTDRVRLGDVLR